MDLLRGHRGKISALTTSQVIEVEILCRYKGKGEVDISCFCVDSDNKLSDDRYFVFYNQPKSPLGEIVKLGAQEANKERFRVELNRLPEFLKHVIFVASIDGEGDMSFLDSGYVLLTANGQELGRYVFKGKDFRQEKALIIIEFYRKDEWRFSVVGQGFNGGLSALLKYYGGEEETDTSASAHEPTPKTTAVPVPAPTPAPTPASTSTATTLSQNGQTASLKGVAPVNIALTYRRSPSVPKAELRLGCMVELKDGQKFMLQTLGSHLGHKDSAPYITAQQNSGQFDELTIYKPEQIKRLLLFTFVYLAPNFAKDFGAVVILKDKNGNSVRVPLLAPSPSQKFCAVATIDFDNKLNIKREECYFTNHQFADQHYKFNFNWV
ncbi:TerD family protein [bacterium]|nr:TerD family protein [bacterium]